MLRIVAQANFRQRQCCTLSTLLYACPPRDHLALAPKWCQFHSQTAQRNSQTHTNVQVRANSAAGVPSKSIVEDTSKSPKPRRISAASSRLIGFLNTVSQDPSKFTDKQVNSTVLNAMKEHPRAVRIHFFNILMQHYCSIDQLRRATELLFLLLNKQGKRYGHHQPHPMHQNHWKSLDPDLVAAICALSTVPSPDATSYLILLKMCAKTGRSHLARRIVSLIRKQEESAGATRSTDPSLAEESIHVSAVHIMHLINAWTKQMSRDYRLRHNKQLPASTDSVPESLLEEVDRLQLEPTELASPDNCYTQVKAAIKQANEWNIPLDAGVYVAAAHSASLTGDIEETEKWVQHLTEYHTNRLDTTDQIEAARIRVVASGHLYVASLLAYIRSNSHDSRPLVLTSITPSAKSQVYYDKLVSTLRESIQLQSSQHSWNSTKQDSEFFLQLQAVYIKYILPSFSHLRQMEMCQYSLAHLEKMSDELTEKYASQQTFPLSKALYHIAIVSCERDAHAYAAVAFFSTFIRREVNSNQGRTDEAMYQSLLKTLMMTKDWSSCVGVLDRIDTEDNHIRLNNHTWKVLAPLLPQVREQQLMTHTLSNRPRRSLSKKSRFVQANVMQDLVNAQALFQEWTTPVEPRNKEDRSSVVQSLTLGSDPLQDSNVPQLPPGANVVSELRLYLLQLLSPPQ